MQATKLATLARMIETLSHASPEELQEVVSRNPDLISKAFFLGPALMDAAAHEDANFAASLINVLHVMPHVGAIQ